MSPPKSVWMPAPMLPTMERERTTMPRTVPSSLVTRKPVRVKAVVLCMGNIFLPRMSTDRHGGKPCRRRAARGRGGRYSTEAHFRRVALGRILDVEQLGGEE